MNSTTHSFAAPDALHREVESLLQAHALSAQRFHADCRRQYRWRGRALQWVEWIDSLLARRFATTLVLIGVPALAIATLV